MQSPYECAFVGAPQAHPLDEDGRSFKLAALGRATRRRDIPTKARGWGCG